MQATVWGSLTFSAGECLLLTAAIALAGCGGSSKSAPLQPGLPTPGSAASLNSYIGTQGAQTNTNAASGQGQGGVYAVTLNDSTKQFSFLDITVPSTLSTSSALPASGTFLTAAGFLDLTTTNATQMNPVSNINPAYAIEIPGRATLLRPGDDTTPVVFAVENENGCPAINGSVTFQFVALPDTYNSLSSTPAFGSVQASLQGSSWAFSNLLENTLGNGAVTASPLPSGICANTLAGMAISLPPDTSHNVPPTTIGIGPSGFFMLDQNQVRTDSSGNLLDFGAPSLIGVIQPANALSVSDLVGGKYLGFIFEPANEATGGVITQPVGFGRVVTGTGNTLTGGIFPHDDLAQAPSTNIAISLGTQDASNNGQFPSASVTEPDPNQVCAANATGTPGKDGSGNPVCTFLAVVIGGNPEGKFALFLIANDPVNSSAMGIYLFQQ